MLRYVLLALAVLALLALMWWSAGRRPEGPGGEQSEKSRLRGGGWPLG
jgi:hypothetical protein